MASVLDDLHRGEATLHGDNARLCTGSVGAPPAPLSKDICAVNDIPGEYHSRRQTCFLLPPPNLLCFTPAPCWEILISRTGSFFAQIPRWTFHFCCSAIFEQLNLVFSSTILVVEYGDFPNGPAVPRNNSGSRIFSLLRYFDIWENYIRFSGAERNVAWKFNSYSRYVRSASVGNYKIIYINK